MQFVHVPLLDVRCWLMGLARTVTTTLQRGVVVKGGRAKGGGKRGREKVLKEKGKVSEK